MNTALRRVLCALLVFSGALFSGALAAQPQDEAFLLVAHPAFRDMEYRQAVLIAAPVPSGGHVGFIINRPTRRSLGSLFPEHEPSKKVVDPLFLGGTVDMNLVFALVERHGGKKDDSIRIAPDLFLAYETKTVDRIIESESEHARFFLGLVVWRPGQLEDELDRGLWYVEQPEAKLVMRRKTDDMWEELVRRLEERANTI